MIFLNLNEINNSTMNCVDAAGPHKPVKICTHKNKIPTNSALHIKWMWALFNIHTIHVKQIKAMGKFL